MSHAQAPGTILATVFLVVIAVVASLTFYWFQTSIQTSLQSSSQRFSTTPLYIYDAFCSPDGKLHVQVHNLSPHPFRGTPSVTIRHENKVTKIHDACTSQITIPPFSSAILSPSYCGLSISCDSLPSDFTVYVSGEALNEGEGTTTTSRNFKLDWSGSSNFESLLSGAVAVAVGGFHTSILMSNGNVYSFGDYNYGQIVDYTGGDAVGVAAGDYHTCILTEGGNVYCYGDNAFGQAVTYEGGDAKSVSVGRLHTCILTENGNVSCVGNNSFNQLINRNHGDVVAVSAGDYHSCVVLNNGNVICSGSNGYGQSNNYTGGNAIGVVVGGYHTCILRSDNSVWCYGRNDFGQRVTYSGNDVNSIAAGDFHSCVLTNGGNVYCYGDNTYGQAVTYEEGDAVGLAAGDYLTCVVKADGSTECFGLAVHSSSTEAGEGSPARTDACRAVNSDDVISIDSSNCEASFTITEQSGNTLTDYQIPITIDSNSLIEAGKMRPDCGDIRFTDENGNNIPYWVECGCGETTTIIWVKVPAVPANGATTVSMAYCDPDANSASNGDAVFEFFDDFEGNSLDMSKWIHYDAYLPEVDDGVLHITGQIYSRALFDYPVVVESSVKYPCSGQDADTGISLQEYELRKWGVDWCGYAYSNGGLDVRLVNFPWGSSNAIERYGCNSSWWPNSLKCRFGVVKFEFKPSALLRFTVVNEGITASFIRRPSVIRVGYDTMKDIDMPNNLTWAEWIFVRKFADVEPVVSLVGGSP